LRLIEYKHGFRRADTTPDPLGYGRHDAIDLIKALEQTHQESVRQALELWTGK
jgi:hypothetical protein